MSINRDEEALVEGAKVNGVTLKNRRSNRVDISVNGVDESYEILNVLEFNSYRKRYMVVKFGYNLRCVAECP
jgi:magnesium-transporting ATPase (P-type)